MSTEFSQVRSPKTVLATIRGMRCPHHGYPEAAWLEPESILPPGLCWYRLPSGKIAPLKRARVKAAVNTATISLGLAWAVLFQTGDTLVSSEKIGISSFSGAWDGTEIVTFDVDGIGPTSINLADSATAIGTASEAANFVANWFGVTGFDALLSVFAFDNATTGNVDLYFVSKTPGGLGQHDVSVAVAGGTGAATDPATSDNIAIGDITAVDTDADTLTIDATVTLPPGLGLMVKEPLASIDAIKKGGIRYEEHSFNITENLGLLTSGTLEIGSMYWDQGIATAFPEIQSL